MYNKQVKEKLDIPTSLRTVRVLYPSIVRHPLFERLNDITQLSFVDKVYRGGKHSRFEHSIFVYHFTHELLYGSEDGLVRRCHDYLSKDEAVSLEIASLLHDIGHPPFSHAMEFLLENLTGKTHHTRAEEIIMKSEKRDKKGRTLRECISEYGVDPKQVLEIIIKRSPISKIISHNSIGTDKLAYTLLDSHHTSLDFRTQPYILDILPYYFFDGKTLGIMPSYERIYKNIGDLQRSYQNMYIYLYFDEEVRECERMFQRAIEEMIKTGEIDKQSAWELDETDIKYLMKNSKNDFVRELNRRIIEKELYTPMVIIKEESCVKSSNEVGLPAEEFNAIINYYENPLNLSKLEESICEKVGIPLSQKYKVMCMIKLTPSRIIPEDVPLFNENGRVVDTFFNIYPSIKRELEETARHNSTFIFYADEDISSKLKDIKTLLRKELLFQ